MLSSIVTEKNIPYLLCVDFSECLEVVTTISSAD